MRPALSVPESEAFGEVTYRGSTSSSVRVLHHTLDVRISAQSAGSKCFVGVESGSWCLWSLASETRFVT